jgi:serine/threonine protein kinase/tetratricopeptide (TPR) repeat protein
MDHEIAPKIIANRFLIKRQIGQGGMGQVLHVYDYITLQDAALKRVLFDPLVHTHLDKAKAQYNFASEFQILASLRHPHIVEVFTYGFDSDRVPYYVMQLLQSPQNFLEATYQLPLKEKIMLTVQMLRALLYLHHRGIIHRDIKPGNVLLADGRLRVLDFGLAAKRKPLNKPDNSSEVIEGTLAYMAPELIKGASFSIASDLYAVGIMLFEAIAGQHPFTHESIMNFVTAVLTEPPNFDLLKRHVRSTDEQPQGTSRTKIIPRSDEVNDLATLPLQKSPDGQEISQKPSDKPSASQEFYDGEDEEEEETYFSLIGIIAKLLEKDPQERYQDAADVIRDLSSAIGEEFPIETRATRESFLQSADFIGRDNELNRLKQALTAAQKGSGSIIVISGERGIGKTRLAQELNTHALVEGSIVTVGSAAAEKAYDIWKDPFQRLVLETKLSSEETAILQEVYSSKAKARPEDAVSPASPGRPASSENPAGPAPQDRQQRLLNTISSLLSRQQEPIVIILEDIHLAGSESLAILRHISQTISSLRLLIVVTFSPDESIPLKDYLAGINYEEIELPRFTREQVAFLSASMLGKSGTAPHIVDFLSRQTEGNVLFMVEIIRALAEETGQLEKIVSIENLPKHMTTGGIVQLLQRRLDRIPADAFPPLRLAAVIGRRVDTALLKQVFQNLKAEEWLNICANANTLEFRQGDWQFTHHKLRDTIQAALTAEELRHLHTQAAEAYIATYADNPVYAANIAVHWRNADQPQKELQYTVPAADYAYRISAFDEALEHYQRALVLLPPEEAVTRRSIQNRIATIYIMQDQLGSAFEVATKTLSEVQADGNSEMLADVQKILGRIAMIRGEFKEAEEHFRQALAIYQDKNQISGIADIVINEGRLLARMGRFDEAMSNARKALALFQQTGNQWDTANTLNLLSSLYGQTGRFPEATEYALKSLQTMQEIGNREGMAGIQSNLGIINLMQRNNAEAKTWLQKAQAIYAEIRQFRGLASCLNNLGMIAMNDGDAADAKALFDQALSYIAELEDPHFKSNIRVNMARSDYLLGQYSTAMSEFKKVLLTGQQINALPIMLEALIGIGHILMQTGDTETVIRIRNVVSGFASRSREVEELLKSLDEAMKTELKLQTAPKDTTSSVSLDDLIRDLTAEASAS